MKQDISIAERVGFEKELNTLKSKRISFTKAQQESSEILNELKKERSIRSFEDAQNKGVNDPHSFDSNIFLLMCVPFLLTNFEIALYDTSDILFFNYSL